MITQHYCHGTLFVPNPWLKIGGKEVCGKPFCVDCTPIEGNRTTCLDCKEYSFTELNEMDEGEIQDLCDVRGLERRRKKIPGMRDMILNDQENKLGQKVAGRKSTRSDQEKNLGQKVGSRKSTRRGTK